MTRTLPDTEDGVLADARADLDTLVRRFADRVITENRTDRIAVFDETTENQANYLALAKEVQRGLYGAGLAHPAGPPELGGRDVSATTAARIEEMVDASELPSRNVLFVGLHIVASAILAHGTDEQRALFLPGLFSGRTVGCQLFSEPGAGSDLASVTTSAVREGKDWIVNGAKVWTSHAHVADWGEALVRTDRDSSVHGGLSMLMVDMHAPGVTVRPLRQMTGDAAFNEVFLDDVRVPDTHRIGEPGSGWQVATTSLSSERGSMGGGGGPLTQQVLDRVADLVDSHHAVDDPARRVQVARAVAAILAVRAAEHRPTEDWGRLGPVSGSIQKMLMVAALDQICTLAGELLGPHAFVETGTPDTHAWSEFILGTPALHLAGGTDEIQRGLIATRGLRLPRESRAVPTSPDEKR